ncbi:MAG: hypothetical protein AAF492_19785 [Verrucomicrobiota bacterium]
MKSPPPIPSRPKRSGWELTLLSLVVVNALIHLQSGSRSNDLLGELPDATEILSTILHVLLIAVGFAGIYKFRTWGYIPVAISLIWSITQTIMNLVFMIGNPESAEMMAEALGNMVNPHLIAAMFYTAYLTHIAFELFLVFLMVKCWKIHRERSIPEEPPT